MLPEQIALAGLLIDCVPCTVQHPFPLRKYRSVRSACRGAGSGCRLREDVRQQFATRKVWAIFIAMRIFVSGLEACSIVL